MDRPQNFVFSVGLRHVLEDSLAVVRGQTLERDRRELVLRNLQKFVTQAMEGSASTTATAFANTRGTVDTIEAYELVHRMLSSRLQNDLVPRLRTTESVLSELSRDVEVDAERRKAAADLIDLLLRSLKYESAASSYKTAEAAHLS
ncbi:hypothetical protein [Bradyrhizobium sp. SZCCHNS1054]|uniref:hypothetical protein n=1 Tax=Bradyrhizobium sp. SZCCHNS1054 TaxID=3057301 RepID=UPI00291645F5|nr:hypothetical protein [Bradyrhizobium sp. SZCCHNS1054]